MNKKNVVAIVLCLLLAVVLGVGGTLAVLTSRDDKVTNTFSFGSIRVELTEALPAAIAQEKITAGTKGYSYANVTPGQLLNKAPSVKVTAEVPVYVFIKVEGLSATISAVDFDASSKWTAIGTPDAYHNGIYYAAVNGTTDFGAIFTQVQTAADATDTTTANSVVIYVSAIQQSGFATVAAAQAAAPAFS